MSSSIYQGIENRLQKNWLLGVHDSDVFKQFYRRIQTIQAWAPTDCLPIIVIAQTDPVKFLGDFFASVALQCPVFIANPYWQESEWQQVFMQVQPDFIWGTLPLNVQHRLNLSSTFPVSQPRKNQENRKKQDPFILTSLSLMSKNGQGNVMSQAKPGWIMIPTGGSSGHIRFAIHTWQTLMESVEGFCEFFQASPVNAYCVLPLYHVSGLMQVLRCFASSGTVAIATSYDLEQSSQLLCDPQSFFISLVPTQLQRLIQSSAHCRLLSQFRAVLLGGAPAWPELLDSARSHHIPLAPTYGMTETASQIATLKPDRFLMGHTSVGQVLPHATVTITPMGSDSMSIHQTNNVGPLEIQCRSLALGYFPDTFFLSGLYHPKDLGFLDHHGELNIVGRASDTIISGGENIFPVEVEAAIRATMLVKDVAVVGIDDRHWGEAVTALYVPVDDAVQPKTIEHHLIEKLSRYKHPKQWIAVSDLPRNAQGKLNRSLVKSIAIANLPSRE